MNDKRVPHVAPTVKVLEGILNSVPEWVLLLEHEHAIEDAIALLESLSARVTQAETESDPYCREERCEFRHWTSGSMPTHKRGRSCPAPLSPGTGNEASE